MKEGVKDYEGRREGGRDYKGGTPGLWRKGGKIMKEGVKDYEGKDKGIIKVGRKDYEGRKERLWRKDARIMTPLPPILLHVSISRQEKILSSKEGKE